MKPTPLTDADMLVLGLVAEMPRHGYELEQEIDRRGMREWTPIGFSSIYFVLGKLEKAGLTVAQAPDSAKSRKVYSITPEGRAAMTTRTLEALSVFRPTYSSLLLGMAHWPLLSREAALNALEARDVGVAAEIERLEQVRLERQPLPDFIEALFDFSEKRLQAERAWIAQTLDYMTTKPWME